MVAFMNYPASMLTVGPVPLRIEDFELLERTGAFRDYGKVELIDGVIEAVNAEYRTHALVKNRLARRLDSALARLGTGYEAIVEATLALPPHNLPEPDLLIAKGELGRDYFRLSHIAIVIEISDTTAARDLGHKRMMYAAQGVPEYWVVQLERRLVHQFWQPTEDGYQDERTLPLDGPLSSITLDQLTIDGSGIL